MKRKLVLTLGFAGVLALSIGFSKGFLITKVSAEGQENISDGDKYRVVTREEQDIRENNLVEGRNLTTVITAEEQKMVENSSALEGFVQQKDGTWFFFKKEK